MKTYVITGATGNTGKPIAKGLLEKGHHVRIISRSAEKADDLVKEGAELIVGDTRDKTLIVQALKGTDAMYAMIPFDMAAGDYLEMQLSHAKAISEAISESKVRNVVFLSSIGAHLTSGAGVVQGLERTEKMLNSIEGINVMHLRASYFMENTLAQIGAVKHMGVMASSLRGDLPLPMVATRDIALMALDHLLNLNFTGINHKYVLGQRDVSYEEVARIFGESIGKPDLRYITVSLQDGEKAMVQMGLGASVSSRLTEMVEAINDGRVLEDAHRNPDNTTSTSIEEFAQIFAYLYSL